MGEALLDQVVPGIDYFPGQGMRSLVAERRITLNAIDIADHFVDHSEYADDIGNRLGKSYFRCRKMSLDSRPVAFDRQLHAQQRIGFRYEGYAGGIPQQLPGEGYIFTEIGRLGFDDNFFRGDTVAERAPVINFGLGFSPDVTGPVTGVDMGHTLYLFDLQLE
jgi:hypothetical protein